jgi:hypothetical protein
MVLVYELYFLKNVSVLNKEAPLSEIGLPFSQTVPLQLFGFYLVLGIMLHLRSHSKHIKLPERNKALMVHYSINNNKFWEELIAYFP